MFYLYLYYYKNQIIQKILETIDKIKAPEFA